MNTFSGSEAVRAGWEIYKKRPWFLTGTFLLFMVVVGAVGFFLTDLGKFSLFVAAVTFVIRFFFQTLAALGMIAFILKAHDTVDEVAIRDLWHPQNFWKFVGSIVAQILVVIGGIIALVIPGIVLSIALRFAPFFVVDKNEGPIESLFSSARITRGNKWAVLQFLALVVAVNIAGALALLVGLFVTIPVTALATVSAYRTLSRE
jgi:uncharacterized membrane protein